MKSGFKLIGLVSLIFFLTIGVQFRDELLKAPRIRVGPLVAWGSFGDQDGKEPIDATGTVESSKRMVRFFVLGDTGTGGEAQYRVARAMEQRCREVGELHGILLLGDNAYQEGFQSVNDPEWDTKVNLPYGTPCLLSRPIYPILGNHDYKGNPTAQVEYSLINPRWRMPNRFYSVYFGDLLRIVAYDSQTNDICFVSAFCSIDFLLDQTKDQWYKTEQRPGGKSPQSSSSKPAQWTLVMGHHPLASASDKGYSHSGGLRGAIFKKLFCNRVDIWLAGHAHHMEYRKISGCKMDHYVLGGGGANLYEIEGTDSEIVFAKSSHGFAEFTVDDAKVTTKIFDDEARLLYEVVKSSSEQEGIH